MKKKPEPGDHWDGTEVTPGGGDPDRRITPRLVGPAVAKFKRLMGVCLTDGCVKIANHDGECS